MKKILPYSFKGVALARLCFRDLLWSRLTSLYLSNSVNLATFSFLFFLLSCLVSVLVSDETESNHPIDVLSLVSYYFYLPSCCFLSTGCTLESYVEYYGLAAALKGMFSPIQKRVFFLKKILIIFFNTDTKYSILCPTIVCSF